MRTYLKVMFVFLLSITGLSMPAHAISNGKVANVTIDPIPLLIGLAGAGVSFSVSERVAIGAFGSVLLSDSAISSVIDGATTSNLNYSIDASTFGVEAMFGLNGPVYGDTWYLRPTVSKVSVSIVENSQGFTGTGEATVAQLMVGYQWLWNSGFNIRLGGGLSTSLDENYEVRDPNNLNSVSESDLENLGTSAALEFKLGWAF